MHVAVGSTNTVKRAAVEHTFERFDPTVETVGVDSGVSEQPRSITETITGAENRATRALSRSESASYGVGLEGGVAHVDGVPGLSLVMWAAVTDGERIGRGGGPSLQLPTDVATRLEAGEELGPVMDDVCARANVAENEGAAGVLTTGLTSRQAALETALACACGPLFSSYYE